MIKLYLQKTLPRAMVTEDELHTIHCEKEVDFNDRALTSISDSVDGNQPLTSTQLMLGYCMNSIAVETLDS